MGRLSQMKIYQQLKNKKYFDLKNEKQTTNKKTMKNKMLILAGLLLTAAVPLIVTSCASGSASAGPVSGGVLINEQTETATVQSVDPDTRTVVLLHSDGTTNSYECGPEVRNFGQIKVGDQVNATVGESVAVVLVKGTSTPAAGATSAMVRAPLGAEPAGKVVDTVAFTANVVGIDAANRTVTLQMPDGSNQAVQAGPNVDLSNVNTGDTVGVQLTRAFAVSVTAPNSSQ
jgi:hypothetical protein